MTFVADESVDKQVVDAIRRLGYEVLSIAESAPGMADEGVLNKANEEHSVLLTADKDFGELVFRQGRVHSGIVLLRLAGLGPEAKARIVVSAIEKHVSELEAGFCVLTGAAVRIRRLSH